jgi:hypothetical protein
MDYPYPLADTFKNFAGRINSNPAKAILHTLQKSFGQCRVLHDLHPGQSDLLNTFVNLVGLYILTWRVDTQSSMTGVLLFSLYKIAVFPLSDRDGLRRLAPPRDDLWHASGT